MFFLKNLIHRYFRLSFLFHLIRCKARLQFHQLFSFPRCASIKSTKRLPLLSLFSACLVVYQGLTILINGTDRKYLGQHIDLPVLSVYFLRWVVLYVSKVWFVSCTAVDKFRAPNNTSDSCESEYILQ